MKNKIDLNEIWGTNNKPATPIWLYMVVAIITLIILL